MEYVVTAPCYCMGGYCQSMMSVLPSFRGVTLIHCDHIRWAT